MRYLIALVIAFIASASEAREGGLYDTTETRLEAKARREFPSYLEADKDYCVWLLAKHGAPLHQMGGCLRDLVKGPPIPEGRNIYPGMSDPRIPLIRHRLSIRDRASERNDFVYRADVVEAVKQYQFLHGFLHGLPADPGILSRPTLHQLNANAGSVAADSWIAAFPDLLSPPTAIEPAPPLAAVPPVTPPVPSVTPPVPSVTAPVTPTPVPTQPTTNATRTPTAPALPNTATTFDWGQAFAWIYVFVIGAIAIIAAWLFVPWFVTTFVPNAINASRPHAAAAGAAVRTDASRLVAWIRSQPRHIVGAVLLILAFVLFVHFSYLNTHHPPWRHSFFGATAGAVALIAYLVVAKDLREAALRGLLLGGFLGLVYGPIVLFHFVECMSAHTVIALILAVPLAMLWWRWARTMGISLWKLYRALENPPIPVHSVDLVQRIEAALPPTSLKFDDVVQKLYAHMATAVPPLPRSFFNEFEHASFQYALEQYASGLGSMHSGMEELFIEVCVNALHPIAKEFPPVKGDSLFTAPVRDRVDLTTAVSDILTAFHDPRLFSPRMFEGIREQIARNREEADKRRATAIVQEIVELMLKDTPLSELLDMRVPVPIHDDLWFESVHVTAGSGGFKTQLLGTIIAHLAAKPRRFSFVLVDSQDSLLRTVEDKFAGQVPLIHINLEHKPLGLNPFDIGKLPDDRAGRGKALNRLSALFTYLFETGASEVSIRMDVLFQAVLKMLLFGVPAAHKRTATFHDLREFMAAPKAHEAFKEAILALPQEDQAFFSKHNIDSYKETRTQILYRIDSLLKDPFLKDALCAERNELKVEDYIDQGGIILCNTNKDAHQDNAPFVGKLMFMVTMQAMLKRPAIDKGDPYPTLMLVDEAQDYFGGTTKILEDFIVQGRKRRFGLVLAHHHYAQAPGSLPSALKACAIQFASKVNDDDVHLLRSLFACSAEFLKAQQPEAVHYPNKPRWTDYALMMPGLRKAVSVRLNYGNLENFHPGGIGGASGGPHTQSPPPPPPPRPGKPNDLVFEVVGHPKKMRDGGTQKVDINGVKVEFTILAGTNYGEAICLKGHGPNGSDVWVILTKHPDLKDEQPDRDEDMDTGAQQWA